MGITCGKEKKPRKESPRSKDVPDGGYENPEYIPEETQEEQIERVIRDMKEYHKNRIISELENDPHTFILDNLLMCIQFFDNFDK